MNFLTKKRLKTLIILLLIFPASKIWGQPILGIWSGKVNQNSIVYNYTLDIKKITKDSIFGITISSSKEFYSETKFKGIVNANNFSIQESELIKTNYKGTGSVCLMMLKLKKNNDRLLGNFTSSNKDIKDCGSGTVSLQLVKEKKNTAAGSKESTPTQRQEIESRPATITLSKPEELPRTTIPAPIKLNDQRKIEQRDIEILNTFRFKEDSVMIKIYDNGVIDGDVITLIVNGNIVFDKIKLTATPLTYALKAIATSQFQIECYADNLGEIPPNTGLITISSSSKTSEVLFSSDLKKSAAIKVILRNNP
ncbi:MAG: hypothetical protein RLZZ595_1114 [Bacteroidota bacterium]|jgi:hypothetical protein